VPRSALPNVRAGPLRLFACVLRPGLVVLGQVRVLTPLTRWLDGLVRAVSAPRPTFVALGLLVARPPRQEGGRRGLEPLTPCASWEVRFANRSHSKVNGCQVRSDLTETKANRRNWG